MASTRSIFVAAQAKVTANVIGRTVTVAGRVDGQIVCTGRVELTPSARVTGDITAGTLIVQEGAVFDGQLKMPSRGGETSAVTVTTRE
jgi:cytoskeletal protein CcmA (bactofilin family)